MSTTTVTTATSPQNRGCMNTVSYGPMCFGKMRFLMIGSPFRAPGPTRTDRSPTWTRSVATRGRSSVAGAGRITAPAGPSFSVLGTPQGPVREVVTVQADVLSPVPGSHGHDPALSVGGQDLLGRRVVGLLVQGGEHARVVQGVERPGQLGVPKDYARHPDAQVGQRVDRLLVKAHD